MPTPTKNAIANDIYQDFHWIFFCLIHQGAKRASGRICKIIVGPFASNPPPKAKAKYINPFLFFSLRDTTMPKIPRHVKNVSIISNINTTLKTAHTLLPKRRNIEISPIFLFLSHNLSAIFFTRKIEANENKNGIVRGHQSLTPKKCHPKLMSQNKSGGLWL